MEEEWIVIFAFSSSKKHRQARIHILSIPNRRRTTEKKKIVCVVRWEKSSWQDSNYDYYDSGCVCALLLKVPSAKMTKSFILQQGCSNFASTLLTHCRHHYYEKLGMYKVNWAMWWHKTHSLIQCHCLHLVRMGRCSFFNVFFAVLLPH